MADLGTALWAAISSSGAADQVGTFGEAVDYLVGQYGSASAAGRAIGVPQSTFRHWVAGRQPRGHRAGGVVAAARRDQARPLPAAGVKMTGRHLYGGTRPEQDRSIDVGRYLDDNVPEDLLDAYRDGATPDQLAEIFVEGISGAPFYTDSLGKDHWDLDSIEGMYG